MTGRLRRLAALLLLVLPAGLAGCAAPTQDDSPQKLPDLTLIGLRAEDPRVNVGELRGPMVIHLWAQWCGPCRREMPVLERFAKTHRDVKVMGVNWQDPLRSKAIAFARDLGVSYPLVRDPDGRLPARFLPQLILVDRDGTVVFRDYVVVRSTAQLERLVRRHLGSA